MAPATRFAEVAKRQEECRRRCANTSDLRSKTLGAVAERYSTLKSDAIFLKLQEELARTEERIALDRAYFNDVCTFSNTRLQTPSVAWLSRLAHFHEHPLIPAADDERAEVRVRLLE